MPDEKVLSILLKMGLDRSASQQVRDGLEKYRGQIKSLEEEAKNLKKSITVALAHGEDTSEFTKNLKSVEKEIENVGKAAKTSIGRELVDAMRKSMETTMQMGERLSRAGMQIGMMGAAGVAAYTMAAQKYIGTLSDIKKATDPYAQALASMENANIRVGKVSADALAPWVSLLAEAQNSFANIAEKSPLLANGLLAISGMAAGGGGLLKLAGEGIKLYADVKLIAASALQSQAADKMLVAAGIQAKASGVSIASIAGGAALTTAGAAGAIAVGGTAIGGYHAMKSGNAVNRMIGQEEQSVGDVFDNGRKALALFSLGLASSAEMFGLSTRENTNNFFQLSKGLLGLGDTADTTSKKLIEVASANEIINRQLAADAKEKGASAEAQLRTRRDNSTVQAELDNQNTLIEINQKYSDQRVAIETKSANDRAAVLQDLATQSAQAEQAYHLQRKQIVRDSGIEINRIEEDSQKQLLQMRKDHETRSRDLISSRDALGLVKENRDFEDKKSLEIDNTNAEIKRRREDIALKLRDLDESYRREQSQRQQAAYARLLQIKNSSYAELVLLADKQNKEIQMQATHYRLILQTMVSEFQKQLVALRTASGYYQNELPTHRASGGPVYAGETYLVGERGPELYTSRRNGTIVPAGLTAAMLNPRYENPGNGRNMTVKIESSSLTMTEILREVDARFKNFERGLGNIFA